MIVLQLEFLTREKQHSDAQLSSMCRYDENLKQQIYQMIKQCEKNAVGLVPYNSTNNFLSMSDIIDYMRDILSKLLKSHLLRLSQAHFPTSDLESMDCMTPDTEDSDPKVEEDQCKHALRDCVRDLEDVYGEEFTPKLKAVEQVSQVIAYERPDEVSLFSSSDLFSSPPSSSRCHHQIQTTRRIAVSRQKPNITSPSRP